MPSSAVFLARGLHHLCLGLHCQLLVEDSSGIPPLPLRWRPCRYYCRLNRIERSLYIAFLFLIRYDISEIQYFDISIFLYDTMYRIFRYLDMYFDTSTFSIYRMIETFDTDIQHQSYRIRRRPLRLILPAVSSVLRL